MLLHGHAAADGQPTTTARIPFEHYRLPNGLEVILHHDDGLPVVRIDVRYRTGSRDDPPGREGLAHLVEHLMFSGTKHVATGDIQRIFGGAGAHASASTGDDATDYFETLPSSQLELGLWLESSRMGFLLDRPEDQLRRALDAERAVVSHELRVRQDEARLSVLGRAMSEALYPPGHPYTHTTLGTQDSVARIELADVRQFVAARYTPRNAILVISGNFDVAVANALVEKYFGPLVSGPALSRRRLARPPLPSGRELTVEAPVEPGRLIVVWPTVPVYTKEAWQLQVLAEVLASGRAARLFRLIEQGVAESVSAEQSGYLHGGDLTVDVRLRSGRSPDEALPVLDQEVNRLRRELLSPAELTRAKNRLRESRSRGLNRLPGRANRLLEYALFRDQPDSLAQHLSTYAETSAPTLRRLARRVFARPRVVFRVVHEPGAPVAGRVTARRGTAWPRALAVRTKVPAPQPVGSPDAPFRHERPRPTADRPVRPGHRRQFTLANGLRVVLFESHVVPTVDLRLVLLAGSAFNGPAEPDCARLTLSLLEEGSTRFGGAQIATTLDSLGARLPGWVEIPTATTGLSTLTEHLDTVLPIWADTVVRPNLEADAFERVRQRVTDIVRRSMSQPSFALEVFHKSQWLGWPVSRSGLFYEGLERIAVDAVRKFHAQHYRPEAAVLVVEGDLTEGQAKERLTAALGAWPRAGGPRPLALAPPSAGARLVLVSVPGRREATLMLTLPTPGRVHPDHTAIQVLTEVLGGPWRRLDRKLRQENGWAYNVRSSLTTLPGSGLWRTDGSFTTERLLDALALIRQEIQTLQAKPVPADELEGVKAAIIAAAPRRFAESEQVVNDMANEVLAGAPGPNLGEYTERVKSLTPAELQRIARTYFRLDHLMTFVAGDSGRLLGPLRQIGQPEIWSLDPTGLTFVRPTDVRTER